MMRFGTFEKEIFDYDLIVKNHSKDTKFKMYIHNCVEYLKDYVKITPDIILNKELLTELVNKIFEKVYREYNRIDEHLSEQLIAEQKVRELKEEMEYYVQKNETQRFQIELLEIKIHNLLQDKKDLEKEVAELKERIKRATSVWPATDAAAMEMFE